MSSKRLNILSALPLVGHPRDSKRITMLREAGFRMEAVAFQRPYHSGRMPECTVESLGEIGHGRYLQRIWKLLLALPRMRRAIRRNDLVYASGPDMAYMAVIAGFGLRRPVILEVGDIREVQLTKGMLGRAVRFVDRLMVNRCAMVVATARGFIDSYFRQWIRTSVPAMVVENKLESEFADAVASHHVSKSPAENPLVGGRPLRIGYFGGLRCAWSWDVLRQLAQARPYDVEIVLAGYPMDPVDLADQAAAIENVHYVGEYQSPGDLPELYARVDLIWACYHPIGPNDWNLRWARPNRFYESCLFQKPLVTRAGCSDAVEIDRFNIGLIVEAEAVADVVNRLCDVTASDIETWTSNMVTLPRSVYVYTTEGPELADALNKLGQTHHRATG